MFSKQIGELLDNYFKKILFQAVFVLSLLCGMSFCLLLLAFALIVYYPESTWWVVLSFIVIWLIYLSGLALCVLNKKREIKETAETNSMLPLIMIGTELAILYLKYKIRK